MTSIRNGLSFDVESFAESSVDSWPVPERYLDPRDWDAEIRANLPSMLEPLAAAGVRATFFILGRVARDAPDVVRAIADAGHEVACHLFEHRRIADPEQFRADLRAAKLAIEQASGRSVIGFRAPEFSITSRTLWALDILREEGFVYDSSIVPTAIHDVYGIAGADRWIHRFPNGLVEVPLSVTRLLGQDLPVAGGGYFRLYPLWLTRRAIRRMDREGRPAIIYLHPFEVGPQICNIDTFSAYRRFRHYVNMDRGRGRLERLLREFKFTTLAELAEGAASPA